MKPQLLGVHLFLFEVRDRSDDIASLRVACFAAEIVMHELSEDVLGLDYLRFYSFGRVLNKGRASYFGEGEGLIVRQRFGCGVGLFKLETLDILVQIVIIDGLGPGSSPEHHCD